MICVCDNDINRAKSKVTCCKMIPSKHKQITSVEHLYMALGKLPR